MIYDSVETMAADSDTIVIATALDNAPSSVSGMDGVVTTFTVVANPQMGGRVASAAGRDLLKFKKGNVIGVRTLSVDELDGFTPGKRYMLFLTETGLDGDPENYFYVTGAGAGAFIQTDEGYERVLPDMPDDLPETLSEADVD